MTSTRGPNGEPNYVTLSYNIIATDPDEDINPNNAANVTAIQGPTTPIFPQPIFVNGGKPLIYPNNIDQPVGPVVNGTYEFNATVFDSLNNTSLPVTFTIDNFQWINPIPIDSSFTVTPSPRAFLVTGQGSIPRQSMTLAFESNTTTDLTTAEGTARYTHTWSWSPQPPNTTTFNATNFPTPSSTNPVPAFRVEGVIPKGTYTLTLTISERAYPQLFSTTSRVITFIDDPPNLTTTPRAEYRNPSTLSNWFNPTTGWTPNPAPAEIPDDYLLIRLLNVRANDPEQGTNFATAFFWKDQTRNPFTITGDPQWDLGNPTLPVGSPGGIRNVLPVNVPFYGTGKTALLTNTPTRHWISTRYSDNGGNVVITENLIEIDLANAIPASVLDTFDISCTPTTTINGGPYTITWSMTGRGTFTRATLAPLALPTEQNSPFSNNGELNSSRIVTGVMRPGTYTYQAYLSILPNNNINASNIITRSFTLT
jgi:hypothetical protein